MRTTRTRSAALALLLAMAAAVAPGQTPPKPTDQPVVVPPPRLPHVARPDAWPQPDYFQEALKLTQRKPRDRVATLRLALPAGRPAPAYIVLPVQTQAFGFAPGFRALAGARLDAELARRGVEASTQVNIVDVHGPFVRRLEESEVARLLAEQPASRAVALYLGHDGADTLFLSLVVRDLKRSSVAHQSLPLVDDPDRMGTAVMQALPALLNQAGLNGTRPPAASGTACPAATWALADLAPDASLLDQACQALAAGTLMPDYDMEYVVSAPPLTESRLAWLARARALAESIQPPTAASRAIAELATRQFVAGALPRSPRSPAPAPSRAAADALAALMASQDPVVSRVARLLAEPLVKGTPVRSVGEVMRRQVRTAAAGVPPFAAAAMLQLAEHQDVHAEIDLCGLEKALPGAMPRAACGPPPATAPAGTASRAMSAVYQDWRLASHFQALRRQAATLGLPERAREVARGIPADLAQHPLMQRLLIASEDMAQRKGSAEELARLTRAQMRAKVDNMVDLQRHDAWVAGYSITEHIVPDPANVFNDRQAEIDAQVDARLLGVLKFDRFVGGMQLPFRSRPNAVPYFLLPQGERMLQGFAAEDQAQWQRHMPPSAAASAPPQAAEPMFGDGRIGGPPPGPQELARAIQSDPGNMDLRIEAAFGRLQRGGAVAEALALIEARPPNRRSDERISESHAWAAPAHAFFFAAEPEAALRLYEKVAAIGTGSASDLYARGRIALIKGRMSDAFEATAQRQQRYDSDYVRRDLAGMLFMAGRTDEAWKLLLPAAAAGRTHQLWEGIMAGHRKAGMTVAQSIGWIKEQGLENLYLNFRKLRSVYPHMLGTMDRDPGDEDVRALAQPLARGDYVEPVWSLSARLVHAAIADVADEPLRQEAAKAMKTDPREATRNFMPNYVWVAWKATQGKDELMPVVRAIELDHDFDGLVSKAMVLALDGRIDESLRFARAARYRLGGLGLGSALLVRQVPAPYQLAFAGYLMHRQTRHEGYRREALQLARGYQIAQPYTAWPYALEALMQPDPKAKLRAACRARHLDPGSFFLKQAAVPGLDDARCRGQLW